MRRTELAEQPTIQRMLSRLAEDFAAIDARREVIGGLLRRVQKQLTLQIELPIAF